MAAAQGTYINPMAALATHATLNGMANSVVPPTSGTIIVLFLSSILTYIQHLCSNCLTHPFKRALLV